MITIWDKMHVIGCDIDIVDCDWCGKHDLLYFWNSEKVCKVCLESEEYED